ncbi:MAG: UvrB/UvrC motif-containing protein [Phycisphaerales bacterium]|nr:UvrB/UvrC motif-containing protein [Phycisphaerales bacterium]MCB9836914.1 UvrB/UvrC motif-containing protein [Phycisphaera sp.]
MNPDLTELLDAWKYEPGKINVRLIESANGLSYVQVRLDLGILQMHLDGRPDGQLPQGFESYLEMVESWIEEASRADQPQEFESEFESDESAGEAPLQPPRNNHSESGDLPFRLTREQCAILRDEAIQYYHRYLALLALEDYERVVRDTTRNLRVLDILARYAEHEEDRESVSHTKSHVTMMRARALASMAIRDNEPKAAVFAIEEGIEALRKHFAAIGHAELFERSSEVQVLQGMKNALTPKLPVSQKAELRKRLDEAVTQENYRLAAILRDELNSMPD